MKKDFFGTVRGLRLCLAVAGLMLLATPAFCQGCSLCYTQAASSGAKTITALKIGILILIVPPTLGSIGMLFVVHRKRNQVRRDVFPGDPGYDWNPDGALGEWRQDE
jgi:hypothetical protein